MSLHHLSVLYWCHRIRFCGKSAGWLFGTKQEERTVIPAGMKGSMKRRLQTCLPSSSKLILVQPGFQLVLPTEVWSKFSHKNWDTLSFRNIQSAVLQLKMAISLLSEYKSQMRRWIPLSCLCIKYRAGGNNLKFRKMPTSTFKLTNEHNVS